MQLFTGVILFGFLGLLAHATAASLFSSEVEKRDSSYRSVAYYVDWVGKIRR